ncbi:dehydrodolichyl diphosphate synthase 6-like [Carex rostrata]
MDGNRRYAKRHALQKDDTNPGNGHQAGFKSLISNLQYCYEIGVRYVTVYAFSIDNFRRDPHEVQALMDLMKAKLEEVLTEEGLLKTFDARINFWGNLELLT